MSRKLYSLACAGRGSVTGGVGDTCEFPVGCGPVGPPDSYWIKLFRNLIVNWPPYSLAFHIVCSDVENKSIIRDLMSFPSFHSIEL